MTHTGCDRQDITRLGTVQDIGVVAVIDTQGLLLAISANHPRFEWIKKTVKYQQLERLRVTDVFHFNIASLILEGIQFCARPEPPRVRTYTCDIFSSDQTYVTMQSQPDGRLVVEVEDFNANPLVVRSIVHTTNTVATLCRSTSPAETAIEMCKAVATGSPYDRAMVYKFLDDLSGEVIFETKDDRIVKSSFDGLRFPAGDIPLPARKAYVQNPVRFIADVDRDPCQLMQKNADVSLSRSYLRGCALPHQKYLTAMGVKSSLSIAIINSKGALWGLVVMHCLTAPALPTVEDRMFFTILSSVASGHIQSVQHAETLAKETEVINLVAQINTNNSLGTFLVEHQAQMLSLFRVTAISLISPEGAVTVVGDNGATLADSSTSSGEVHDVLEISTLQNPLRSLACLRVMGYTLAFVRESSYTEVAWAGNPRELQKSNIQPDLAMPRKSFQKYMCHHSTNPPPFGDEDSALIRRTGDLLKSAIHHIKMEQVQRQIALTTEKTTSIQKEAERNFSFFANMSHELRTPLHAITGVFDILHNMGGDDSKRFTQIGLNTCTDMMVTLNNILHIVKKTHEEKSVQASLMTLQELFETASVGLHTFAEKNGVAFDTVYESDRNALIRIDGVSLKQVYNNLCGNAIKFSECNQRVLVTISFLESVSELQEKWRVVSNGFMSSYDATSQHAQDPGAEGKLCRWLLLQVRDHGCGIHPKEISKVFALFSQGGDVVKKKFAGTGLGLNICVDNVARMKGALRVASTPDAGTLMFCAVPVEAESRSSTGSSSSSSTSTRAGAHSTTETGEKDSEKYSDKPLHFLVVDDSKVNVMLARKQIERAFAGATVHTALDGKLAVEEIERLTKLGEHIDGVFMDYHMPVLDGLEATRQLRTNNSPIPITILTADVTETSRQAIVASGADFILLKPSRPHQVVEMCVKMTEKNTS